MNRTLPRCVSLVFLIACWTSQGVSQSASPDVSEIRSVVISPDWIGLGQPTNSIVTITNRGGVFHFKSHGTEANGIVDPVRLRALLKAIDASAIKAPYAKNMGITPAWLEQHADDQVKITGTLGEENNKDQRQYFRRSFTDLKLVQSLLPGIVGSRWTDDYPFVRVVITFSDGRKWTTESGQQPGFMLPWVVRVPARRFTTYNADIPRAIAALLPAGTVNRERLAGAGLDTLIRHAVEARISNEWHRIGAEDRAGAALAQLRTRYKVRHTEVNAYHGLAYGQKPEEGITPQMYLKADLYSQRFPKNLVIATAFPIRDGIVDGINTFFAKRDQYEKLVLGNPWLVTSLRSHPDLGAWLIFSDGCSLTEKALRIFAADMHELGRDDIAAEVSKHREEVALLNYYGNQLILFPDHHAVVWRWGAYRELFRWPASSLKTTRCTEYNTVTEGCVAAIIMPDGTPQK